MAISRQVGVLPITLRGLVDHTINRQSGARRCMYRYAQRSFEEFEPPVKLRDSQTQKSRRNLTGIRAFARNGENHWLEENSIQR